MATEVPLKNPTVVCAIENRPPRFELADSRGRLARVQLGHTPIIDVLPATHGIGEMDAPAIAIIDIRQRGRDSALSHNRVRLAQKRLADKPYMDTRCRRFDGRSQTGSARANYQNVVVVGFILGHAQRELKHHAAKCEWKCSQIEPAASAGALDMTGANRKCRRVAD
jgi:hypothetical protein